MLNEVKYMSFEETGEYNLKYNVESVTEDYFMPVRGGDSGTEIDTLPGLSNNDAVEDIEYCFREKSIPLNYRQNLTITGLEKGSMTITPFSAGHTLGMLSFYSK